MSRLIGRASDTVGAPTVPQRPALKYIESGCVITNRGSTTTAPTHTHMGGRGYSTVLVQEFVLYGNFFSSRTAAGSPKSRNNHPPRLPLHPLPPALFQPSFSKVFFTKKRLPHGDSWTSWTWTVETRRIEVSSFSYTKKIACRSRAGRYCIAIPQASVSEVITFPRTVKHRSPVSPAESPDAISKNTTKSMTGHTSRNRCSR